jgi:hypothetical protein
VNRSILPFDGVRTLTGIEQTQMGKRIKASEEFARRIVERELKRPVVINDDNSAPGMYDLHIGPADAPEVAIECVGAVDQTYTEKWNSIYLKMHPRISSGDKFLIRGFITYNTHPKTMPFNWRRIQDKIMNIEI